MYLSIICKKGDYDIVLSDSAKRVIYAGFHITVRNNSICRYNFDNFKLCPMTFHYWCGYVSGLSLFWLKRHANNGFFVDEDFEFR